MKKLPLGIQDFRKIIEGGYVYVDKTQYVYNLLNDASYYFLSRPRRFGKSLLLDTIGEVFSGDREFFKGLWIYDSDYDFKKHPVIRIDLSGISNETPDVLKKSLVSNLKKRIKAESLDIADSFPADMLISLIEDLNEKYGERVVVLIDEYDKPILDHLNNVELAEANRMVLRGFYGVLKSMDAHLRFTLLTGVSKFTKTSIFSELNNLLDLTMVEKYANICGVPVESLELYFGEHIQELAANKRFQSYENVRAGILAWYDGYSWDGETKLINPFSLLSFFSAQRFSSFWYASGSPKFLIDLIKKNPDVYLNLSNLEMSEDMLDSVEIEDAAPEPLMFQTGYLTVKEVLYPEDAPEYRLQIPNFEVKRAFGTQILASLTGKSNVKAGQARKEIMKALQVGDLPKIRQSLRGLFASIPYELHVPVEAYYHSIFYTVMNLLGFDVDAEVSVAGGRADAVLELGDKVYVIEFKYQNCPRNISPEDKEKLFATTLAEGLQQIKEKGYANKYAGSGKTIHLAAFAFLGRDEIELLAETQVS